MNIKVQRQKPNRGEGSQGEMRLVMMGRGSWLYIKGGNQWHTLNLQPSEEASTVARQVRGDLERNINAVVDPAIEGAFTVSGDTYLNVTGAIMNPSGKGRKAALPDVPL